MENKQPDLEYIEVPADELPAEYDEILWEEEPEEEKVVPIFYDGQEDEPRRTVAKWMLRVFLWVPLAIVGYMGGMFLLWLFLRGSF